VERLAAENFMRLNALVLFFSVLGICGGAAIAQTKPQDTLFMTQTFEKQVTKTVRSDYLLFLPKGYDAKAGKNWPLILFLHGAGERGTDAWRVDIHGPSKYILAHPDFPFIMVSPLCPENQTWSNEVLLELLDKVMAEHQVDTNRVYLTGLSMGGYGAWSLALAHPEKFAAVIPICGGGDTLGIHLARTGFTTPARKEALKGLSIWAFHGGKDTVIPPAESAHMIDTLKMLGVTEAKLTVYPEAQHNSWVEAYNTPEIYEWLLKHQRTAGH
jgi:predicted peptidase